MDTTQMLLLALGGAAGGVVLLAAYGFLLATSGPVAAPPPAAPARPRAAERTFVLNLITERIGGLFAPAVLEHLGDKRRAAVQRRIDAAGRPHGLTVEQYVRRKVGEVLLYGGAALLLLLAGWSLLGLLFAAFVFFSDIDLYTAGRKRRDEIQTQLPDFLDVLAVTVGAGLAFRQALERTADSMPGVLAEEFRVALREMELGTSRKEAFETLRQRNQVEALSQFVTAIQQAEELGAPLSQSLSEISTDVRRSDAQYMRRKAQSLNPRVTMITGATLLPALMVLIVGALFIGSEVDFGSIFGS